MKRRFTFLTTLSIFFFYGTMMAMPLGAGAPESFNDIRMKVFPNPSTSGEFAIEFENLSQNDEVEVLVYNLIGKKIFHLNIQGKSGFYREKLDLGNRAKGIYMLQIRQGDNKITKRLSYI